MYIRHYPNHSALHPALPLLLPLVPRPRFSPTRLAANPQPHASAASQPILPPHPFPKGAHRPAPTAPRIALPRNLPEAPQPRPCTPCPHPALHPITSRAPAPVPEARLPLMPRPLPAAALQRASWPACPTTGAVSGSVSAWRTASGCVLSCVTEGDGRAHRHEVGGRDGREALRRGVQPECGVDWRALRGKSFRLVDRRSLALWELAASWFWGDCATCRGAV